MRGLFSLKTVAKKLILVALIVAQTHHQNVHTQTHRYVNIYVHNYLFICGSIKCLFIWLCYKSRQPSPPLAAVTLKGLRISSDKSKDKKQKSCCLTVYIYMYMYICIYVHYIYLYIEYICRSGRV